ncbi:MAG: DNA repair protein RecN [Chloroflexus aggregans]|uniref:DNA repair protein RecN n=1 Tax=Chloroflexus aggregans TaxID=152260 RepID=A0A2J6XB67_9CHLR|nr:MAG: DNA repair protein RecN [Chloroflexus aggregans]
MLIELQIQDFAIIDRLHLRFEQGFTVLTGETGAGKSIIIDALSTLRGERVDPTFVRAGCPRARVEGVFSLDDCPHILPLLTELGLLTEDDDQVILVREISAESGRSIARINGRAVNSATLREIGSRLIDIHGQHEGQSLFNPRTHLELLDRFGDLLPIRQRVADQLTALRTVQAQLAELRTGEAHRQERIEELEMLRDDVMAAKLKPGEEEALLRERTIAQNAARIASLTDDAYRVLYAGSEGRSGRSAIDAMALAVDALNELSRFDPRAIPLAQQATDIHYQLEDLVAALRSYRADLDIDPRRLDMIEERLTVLRDLQRKYGVDLATLIERATQAEAELENLRNRTSHIADLEKQEQALQAELARLAIELSQRRRQVGDELSHQIIQAMQDLAMPNVHFAVQITYDDDPQGLPVNGRRVACDRTGIDRVEFLIAPNPGEPLKPLARIASGGESARLLLALKSILSRVDEVPTLIFDEIDTGVGGRAGHVVGQKLWAISQRHQVLCITHLPQVAAFANAHYHIRKEVHAGRTRTSVEVLSAEQRIDELAAMLDGVPNDHSRANARQILERAQTWKSHRQAELMTKS